MLTTSSLVLNFLYFNEIVISLDVNYVQYRRKIDRESLKETLRKKVKNYDYKKKVLSTFASFPRSLNGYSIRSFLGDLIAGITVCKLSYLI